MDWVKIYDKHLFRWPLKEIGAVVRLQLLTAKLERIPTLEEMAQEVPATTLRAVQARLKPPARPLQEVLELVLEDVQAVVDRRRGNRLRQEKWRDNNKNKDTRRVMKTKHNGRDKIREDKIREDKSITEIVAPSDATPSPVLEFSEFFGKEWSNRVGQGAPYPHSFGKERKLIKDLLTIYSLADMKLLAKKFFASDDKWLKDKGYTIGIFVGQIPKLLAVKKGGLEEALEFAEQIKTAREGQNAGR